MIAKLITRLVSATVYVQLREDRLKITHMEKQSVYDQRPYIAINNAGSKKQEIMAVGDAAYRLRGDSQLEVSNPFSHPRVLISHFSKVEKVLTYGIREVLNSGLIPPSPIVIMHPMEKLEGGVTEIECRVYRELAMGAGAREVYIHIGRELSPHSFSLNQLIIP